MHTKLLFMTLAGSHLYGTNIETSDRDERGVCFQPVESILGLQNFESRDNGWLDNVDRVVYGLRQFFLLAQECNPNILELLYAPTVGKTCVFSCGDWSAIRSYRHAFLSKRKIADRFIGYAHSQFKKMETHREWLTNPPTQPDPLDYGLEIVGDTQHWSDHSLKLQFDSDKREYDNYRKWLSERNPSRHALEVKYGYDAKNGMHLVRLLDQGIELLKTGELTLPRPNAGFLLSVRHGDYTFDELEEMLKAGKAQIDDLVNTSNLPEKPDYKKISSLYGELTKAYIKDDFFPMEI